MLELNNLMLKKEDRELKKEDRELIKLSVRGLFVFDGSYLFPFGDQI